jgi:hypothetical protein
MSATISVTFELPMREAERLAELAAGENVTVGEEVRRLLFDNLCRRYELVDEWERAHAVPGVCPPAPRLALVPESEP